MKLHFYSRQTCKRLTDSIAENLPFYRGEEPHPLLHESSDKESGVELGAIPSLSDHTPAGDAQNAIDLYQWLKLTPIQAADCRIWTCLSHGLFADYVRGRWDTINEGTVKSHFFMNGTGFTPRVSNALSRLWWGAHLTFETSNSDPFRKTKILFSLQDISQSMLERAYGMSKPLLNTTLNAFGEGKFQSTQNRSGVIKETAKSLNTYGATALFEGIPEERLEFVVRNFLKKEMT
jgi:hypothetical protein